MSDLIARSRQQAADELAELRSDFAGLIARMADSATRPGDVELLRQVQTQLDVGDEAVGAAAEAYKQLRQLAADEARLETQLADTPSIEASRQAIAEAEQQIKQALAEPLRAKRSGEQAIARRAQLEAELAHARSSASAVVGKDSHRRDQAVARKAAQAAARQEARRHGTQTFP